MEDSFLIKVDYQGALFELESWIIFQGYQHKIGVTIDGITVLFEPDEERNYRAVLEEEQMGKSKMITAGLLEAIAAYLELFLKE